MIAAEAAVYESGYANIHRGVHRLSMLATDAYEKARESVRRFLNAKSTREIVFLRGTTEAINLVAQTYGRKNVGAGDEVLITALEHHSNIVPWQLLCAEKGARLRGGADRRRGRGRPRGLRAAALAAHPHRRRSPTSRTRSAPSTRCGA